MIRRQRQPLSRLRPTQAARRRAWQLSWAALVGEERHVKAGEAAARRGDASAAKARLRAMDAYRAIALRWMRTAQGRAGA